jgi:phage I-like protein
VISHLAALTQSLPVAGREFRILPAGVFRAKDGRPAHLPGWKIDAEIAQRVIAASASVDDLVIDYEHQTLNAEKNGHPAPAAGWFRRMVWREGTGLFAVDVKWTDKARAMIAAGEYRYISPVFPYNAVNRRSAENHWFGTDQQPGVAGLGQFGCLVGSTCRPCPTTSI